MNNYLFDKNFKLNIINDQLYISNFKEILNLSLNNVRLKNDNIIDINGTNLLVKKLTKDEILIEGKIDSIIFK